MISKKIIEACVAFCRNAWRKSDNIYYLCDSGYADLELADAADF